MSNYRRKTVKKESLAVRAEKNSDLIFGTIGVILLLAVMGYPLIKQTTEISNYGIPKKTT